MPFPVLARARCAVCSQCTPRVAPALARARTHAACASDSDKLKKPPFAYWKELTDAGVSALFGDIPALSSVLPSGATFDVVVDNNGKDMDAVGPVIEAAKKHKAAQFLFVSSAGIYKTGDELPHLEGDAVKADAGHALVENALRAGSMQWASFRPQYLTGALRRRFLWRVQKALTRDAVVRPL